MSRSRKDSRKVLSTVLEVVLRDDGTFDLIVNRKLDRGCISERYLPDELCVRSGFCGEEYEAILREVHQNGRKAIIWG